MRFKIASALAAALLVGALAPGGSASAAKTKTVKVKLLEFQVRPKPTSVKAGNVRFKAKNIGTIDHEMVVVRTDGASLPVSADGSVDEEGVSESATIGEVEDVAPKKSKVFKAKALTPGTYTLFCNIVETTGGTLLVHYARGMHTTFTVR
ncbi:MAG: cupredoxin domain-containing protein [Acidimicrobiia bacterium]